MIDLTEYIVFFRLFDFLNSWWGVKMINFTDYILIFPTFRLMTSCWEVKMFDFTEYIGNFWLLDFSNSWRDVKMIKFTEYIDAFSFRPLAGRSHCSILLDISIFFDFSTLDGGGGGRNWPRGKIHGASGNLQKKPSMQERKSGRYFS